MWFLSGLIILLTMFGVGDGCSPDRFNRLQWRGGDNSWFEWWYYKVVLPETGDSFFFLYGIVNPWDTSMSTPNSGAYVSAGSFRHRQIIKQEYSVEQFMAAANKVEIIIGDQTATDSFIRGHLTDKDGDSVSWDVTITKRWSSNAMGWPVYIPGITNIYWYPVQGDALFTGQINFKGQVYRLEDAPGYQDRNWGTSFPSWWMWLAANHFDDSPDTVLVVGGGSPLLFGFFPGYANVTVILFHEGREYQFRPPDFAVVFCKYGQRRWRIEATNGSGYRIEIDAAASEEILMFLDFKMPDGGIFRDYQTLTGDLNVNLYKRHPLSDTLGSSNSLSEVEPCQTQWEKKYTLRSRFAGLEIGFPLETSDAN